jgi:hypothetical protein
MTTSAMLLTLNRPNLQDGIRRVVTGDGPDDLDRRAQTVEAPTSY